MVLKIAVNMARRHKYVPLTIGTECNLGSKKQKILYALRDLRPNVPGGCGILELMTKALDQYISMGCIAG